MLFIAVFKELRILKMILKRKKALIQAKRASDSYNRPAEIYVKFKKFIRTIFEEGRFNVDIIA